ncbi:MAG: carbohydrate-binding domain-containing protein [Lachnospiraceae bacterium]|nr:carbohydrate-binding domain-containing protein [Lachnospiraceae bacterium]
MTDSKRYNIISIVVIILAVAVTILFINGEALGMTVVEDQDAEGTEEGSSEYFSKSDLDGDWYRDRNSITKIILDGNDIKISGSGAYEYNGDAVISRSGWYSVSGSLDDGSIIVNADSSSKVWILLDNAEVYASDDAALRVDQADKVFLTLAEGSENRLECGDTMSDEAEDDNTNGAVFAHDDLTINGSGSLSIVSEYEHGIKEKDSLKICGGNISIKANADGIHINDHFKMTGAEISIDAMDDGICSETDLLIVSGGLLISDCYEGLESPQITVLDGDIEIYPDDDGFNANGGSSGFGNIGFFGKESESGNEETEAADPCITIRGGNIKIVNEDARDADGLDSNKDIFIYGGNILISLPGGGSNNGIDFGSESGGVCEIHGGTLISCGGSGMVEALSETSTQNSFLYNMGNNTSDDVSVVLRDGDGNVIMENTVPIAFNSVCISSPDMKTGETYTLEMGDKKEEITLDFVSTVVGGISSIGDFGNSADRGMKLQGNSEEDGDGEDPERPEMPEGTEMPKWNSDTEDADAFGKTFGDRGMRGGMRGGMPGKMTEGGNDEADYGMRPGTGNNEENNAVNEKAFGKQMFNEGENTESVAQVYESKAKSLAEYDAGVWKYLTASAIVLAAALLTVKLFRR